MEFQPLNLPSATAALDEVETVIENLLGKVVVTSDHGNGMGEWGVYAHPRWARLIQRFVASLGQLRLVKTDVRMTLKRGQR